MALPAEIVEAVAERVAGWAGLELPAWVIETRAAARIDALEIEPAAYVALIGSARGAGELDELIEAVRVGESRLFRHRSQIEALVSAVAPALRAAAAQDRAPAASSVPTSGGRREVRVWSAGCAAGQEPYTLAAVLSRALPGCAISIVATDISEDALALARAASYPVSAADDVPDAWRDAFYVDGDRVRVRAEIAGSVRFERANLVDGFSPRGCDLVWCRNVLIYFTPAARRLAIQRIVGALNPGGFVFVGYSESLRDIAELEPVRAGDAVFYRVAARPRIAEERRTQPVPIADTHPGARPIEFDKDHTPPPMRIPDYPPPEDVLILRGHPDARSLIADITARLGMAGLVRLVIDLDGCELLGDELAPVLRRARAAGEAAGIEISLRAVRAGARRWLARHGLEDPP